MIKINKIIRGHDDGGGREEGITRMFIFFIVDAKLVGIATLKNLNRC